MSDRVNPPYKTEGSRVYGNGKSYNCTNIITAKELCCTLNQYEKDIQLTQNTTEQYDKLNQQIIALQMDVSNVQDTLNKIKETIQCLSK